MMMRMVRPSPARLMARMRIFLEVGSRLEVGSSRRMMGATEKGAQQHGGPALPAGQELALGTHRGVQTVRYPEDGGQLQVPHQLLHLLRHVAGRMML